ncbi:hypothetical protein BH10ACT2_BH10ACT2_26520 [soil metagenome]
MTHQGRVRLLVVSTLLATAAVVAQSPNLAVAAPLPLTPIVAGGDHHSLILDGNHTLYTFGTNEAGQLGFSENSGTDVPNPIPTQIMTGVAQVAAGAYHSIALKTDGTVWTFGDNEDGQLGRATNSGTATPNPVPAQVVGLPAVIVAIAAGGFHSLAVDAAGNLWTWGLNDSGQLGTAGPNLGTGNPNPTPTQVTTLSHVSQIAAGAFHSLVLTDDANVWAFGWNLDGQIGNSLNAGEFDSWNDVPTQVAELSGIKAIAAGGYHSLALSSDGHVWAFGWNFYGQLGNATNNGVLAPAPPNYVPEQVAGLTGVKAIEAGESHTLALKTDGTLWTFGYNFDGQLGRIDGVDSDDAQPLPTQVLTDVEEIAGGLYHSVVFTAGGLLAFGNNLYGQLGISSTSSLDQANPTPTTVYAPEYRPLEPRRLLDSRLGGTTVDGVSQGIGPRVAGSTTQLQVTDRGAAAPVAAAVVLNVTATGATSNGFITVFPCGSPVPTASNLNFRASLTIPNLVIAQVGVGGKVCLFTSQAVNLIADVAGYYPIFPTFASVGPHRLLDTRPGGGTYDLQFQGIGQRAAGSTLELKVASRGDVDVDAVAAVLNVTVTGAQSGGFVTVYPCGDPRPNSSNINFTAGITIPNSVITKIGVDGKVCIYTSAATQLLADVSGFYPNLTGYEPLVPARLMDTRSPGGATVDHQFQAIGLRQATSTTELQVTDRGAVAADAGTVVVNITATGAQSNGFVTVYPCGSARPNTSNLNYGAGVTIANLVITKIGTGGKICLYTSQTTNLIVDVDGYYHASP